MIRFFNFINFKVKFTFNRRNLSSNPYLLIFNNYLYINYQNIRCLRTKLHILHTNIVLSSYDIFILTESWLTEEFTNAELCLDGYIIFRCDSRCGGGVLITVKNKLLPNIIISPSVEQLFVFVSIPSCINSLLTRVNLPPNSDNLMY